MSYWTATNDYLNRHGQGPTCPRCGQKMFPQDDHGRFTCLCSLSHGFNVVSNTPTHTSPIPQADVSGMTDEEKAQVPPIHRLQSTPTAAEARVFAIFSRGPDAMDDPEYAAACEALEQERRGNE